MKLKNSSIIKKIHQYQLKKKYTSDDLIILARQFSGYTGTCLLLSGSTYDSAEKSFLCLFPFESMAIQNGNFIHKLGVREEIISLFGANPWEVIKKKIHSIDQQHSMPEWVGYLSYEMGAYHDADVTLARYENEYPDAYFQRCATVLMLEHKSGKLTVHTKIEGIELLGGEQRNLCTKLLDRSFWSSYKEESPDSVEEIALKLETPLDDIETYKVKIAKAKEHIFAGDIYQVNISQECSYRGIFQPFNIFLNLNKKNPAPFSVFLNLFAGHSIVSSSPERLLKKRGNFLETRPIKGTISRGKSQEEDEKNRELLLSSEKNKSELLMITDLMRNDLGKVSLPGSVETKKMWHCEGYSNVYHLLSIIQSEALPSIHPLDLIRAVFPGGSITGCPKIRSMQIIADIEKSRRGIYTGSIGYFSGNGDFDFNILIRTLDIKNDLLSLRLGGAIVADSDPLAEYEETLHKGDSIFQCLSNDCT